MSTGKSLSYTLDKKALRAKEKADALRRQREAQATQERNLRLSELNWQANQVYAGLQELAAQVRQGQAESPTLVKISLDVDMPPAADSESELSTYVARVSAQLLSAQAQWRQARARIDSAKATRPPVTATPGAPRTVNEVFGSALPASANATPGVPARDALVEIREVGLTALRRFLDEQRVALPSNVDAAYRALASAASEAEASKALMGLSREIHQTIDVLTREREDARQLTATLPRTEDDSMQEVRAKLQAVAAGKGRLGPELRASVMEIVRAEAESEQASRQQAADIVQNALENLGYLVEPIHKTLFVDGGAVHFRSSHSQPGYYVRMKVERGRDCMDFDLVRDRRAPSASSDAEEELVNAWCNRLPELQRLLRAAGFNPRLVRDVPLANQAIEEVKSETLNRAFWEGRQDQAPTKAAPVPKARTMGEREDGE